MTRRRRPATPPSVRGTLESLLARPPSDMISLERRLAALDPAAGRRALVDLARDGRLTADHLEFLGAALHVFGAGREYRDLLPLVLDDERDEEARGVCMFVLGTVDQASFATAVQRLPPAEALRLSSLPLLSTLDDAESAPTAAASLADAFDDMPREMWETVLAFLEERRGRVGASAVLAYREMLRRPGLAGLRQRLLDLIVAGDPPAAAYVLESLRDAAPDDATRSAFQGALLRLSTRALSETGGRAAPRAEALVTPCDGQACYIILCTFEHEGGAITIADLCMRGDREVRDGFLVPRTDRGELAELVERITEGSDALVQATAPPLEVGALVARAAESTRRAGKRFAADAEAPLLRISALAPGPAVAAPPIAPAAAIVPDVTEVRALLDAPLFESWFWDAGDLAGAKVALPRKPRSGSRWRDEALGLLARAETGERLVAMAEHMARWFRWRGDAARAGAFAALADATRRDFVKSPLARVMLERSLRLTRSDHGDHFRAGAAAFGDPYLRARLRVELFDDVREPTGYDLARLDFTEIAHHTIGEAMVLLPGPLRPRADHHEQLALAVATAFAEAAFGRRRFDRLTDTMAEAAERILGAARSEVAPLVMALAEELARFTHQVCSRCPVACLGRPDAEMGDEFYAESHPALPED